MIIKDQVYQITTKTMKVRRYSWGKHRSRWILEEDGDLFKIQKHKLIATGRIIPTSSGGFHVFKINSDLYKLALTDRQIKNLKKCEAEETEPTEAEEHFQELLKDL
jgi:hypothetical protein